MKKIRVTKVFTFDMAHALFGYDGPCKNIHGHTYRLSVTLIGEQILDENNPKEGMVIDFTDFKRIVKENVIDINVKPNDNKCLLQLNNVTGKITVIKQDDELKDLDIDTKDEKQI